MPTVASLSSSQHEDLRAVDQVKWALKPLLDSPIYSHEGLALLTILNNPGKSSAEVEPKVQNLLQKVARCVLEQVCSRFLVRWRALHLEERLSPEKTKAADKKKPPVYTGLNNLTGAFSGTSSTSGLPPNIGIVVDHSSPVSRHASVEHFICTPERIASRDGPSVPVSDAEVTANSGSATSSKSTGNLVSWSHQNSNRSDPEPQRQDSNHLARTSAEEVHHHLANTLQHLGGTIRARIPATVFAQGDERADGPEEFSIASCNSSGAVPDYHLHEHEFGISEDVARDIIGESPAQRAGAKMEDTEAQLLSMSAPSHVEDDEEEDSLHDESVHEEYAGDAVEDCVDSKEQELYDEEVEGQDFSRSSRQEDPEDVANDAEDGVGDAEAELSDNEEVPRLDRKLPYEPPSLHEQLLELRRLKSFETAAGSKESSSIQQRQTSTSTPPLDSASYQSQDVDGSRGSESFSFYVENQESSTGAKNAGGSSSQDVEHARRRAVVPVTGLSSPPSSEGGVAGSFGTHGSAGYRVRQLRLGGQLENAQSTSQEGTPLVSTSAGVAQIFSKLPASKDSACERVPECLYDGEALLSHLEDNCGHILGDLNSEKKKEPRKLTVYEAKEVYNRLWQTAQKDVAKKHELEVQRRERERAPAKQGVNARGGAVPVAGQRAAERLYRDAGRRKRSASSHDVTSYTSGVPGRDSGFVAPSAGSTSAGIRPPSGGAVQQRKKGARGRSRSGSLGRRVTAAAVGERLYQQGFASRERRSQVQQEQERTIRELANRSASAGRNKETLGRREGALVSKIVDRVFANAMAHEKLRAKAELSLLPEEEDTTAAERGKQSGGSSKQTGGSSPAYVTCDQTPSDSDGGASETIRRGPTESSAVAAAARARSPPVLSGYRAVPAGGAQVTTADQNAKKRVKVVVTPTSTYGGSLSERGPKTMSGSVGEAESTSASSCASLKSHVVSSPTPAAQRPYVNASPSLGRPVMSMSSQQPRQQGTTTSGVANSINTMLPTNQTSTRVPSTASSSTSSSSTRPRLFSWQGTPPRQIQIAPQKNFLLSPAPIATAGVKTVTLPTASSPSTTSATVASSSFSGGAAPAPGQAQRAAVTAASTTRTRSSTNGGTGSSVLNTTGVVGVPSSTKTAVILEQDDFALDCATSINTSINSKSNLFFNKQAIKHRHQHGARPPATDDYHGGGPPVEQKTYYIQPDHSSSSTSSGRGGDRQYEQQMNSVPASEYLATAGHQLPHPSGPLSTRPSPQRQPAAPPSNYFMQRVLRH
ncbi:unnamed protein product [Amoebophrya sp. A25]|nr:unnamed protein product [Amoebophrya sp. A25]|eukprot:GSA25T00016206001.1